MKSLRLVAVHIRLVAAMGEEVEVDAAVVEVGDSRGKPVPTVA
jgi:hypothetical protein